MTQYDILYREWKTRKNKMITVKALAKMWPSKSFREPSLICCSLRRMGANIRSHKKGRSVHHYELINGPAKLHEPRRLTPV
jgi:hypothetical protein